MTRDKIINETYKSGIIEKLANNNRSILRNYKDDFILHMYEILCLIDSDKLINLYNKGELDYYLIYVCKAQIFNDKSEFWKLHKGRLDTVAISDDTYIKNNEIEYD